MSPTHWQYGATLITTGIHSPSENAPIIDRREEIVEAFIPDPPTGLVVTKSVAGKGYCVTHAISGYSVGRTAFPLVVAKNLCKALSAIEGVDWTLPIEHLLADRERLRPLVFAAAEPFISLEVR